MSVQNSLLLGSSQTVSLPISSRGSLSWLRIPIQVLGFGFAASTSLEGAAWGSAAWSGEMQRSLLAGTSILPWFLPAVIDWSLQCWAQSGAGCHSGAEIPRVGDRERGEGEMSRQAGFIQAVAWQCCSKVPQHNEIHKRRRQLNVQ